MINKLNVLIFSAGSENSINIYDLLKFSVHGNYFSERLSVRRV